MSIGKNAKLPHLFYGGDYNPEQWPEEVWARDMELMKEAGVNMVSIGIFSWALLQPEPDRYDFAWMDRLMDLLAENGIKADLATATASPPAWLAKLHPESLPVDENGARYVQGSRQHYCPNSKAFRLYGQKLVRLLAERYKDHPALAMWHINNEYGCHISRCYCGECAKEFRQWLQKRYGALEELNSRWGTNFWSQKVYDWEEIGLPGKTPTYSNPGGQLDYARFMSDSLLDAYLGEYRILREITPELPIMTNFLGAFKPLDEFEWAKHMDVVTWDSYPEPMGGIPVFAAMQHDLMRSLKSGEPFILMEQATSQVNWRTRNPLKRPGVMRLWSYQAVARGGDGVMFFQWRQSRAGAEKFHGAMVTHTGDANSRIYREVKQLGLELQRLDTLVNSRVEAPVAIVFDWHNWWALELDSKPSRDVKYIEQIQHYYKPLFEANVGIDFVQPGADLSGYKLVVAPALYMVKMGEAANLESYVRGGGTLILTFFSGIVDENDRVHLGGYPAPFRSLLGLTVEEFDPMLPGQTNGISVSSLRGADGEYPCSLWADLIRLEGAEAIAAFTSDFFSGAPAVTVHHFGQGRAYYVGTQPDPAFTAHLLAETLRGLGIEPPLSVPAGVEVTVRYKDGERYMFLLNHRQEHTVISLPEHVHYSELITGCSVHGTIALGPNDVAILALS
ncbi:beta-galactosidase [Paenibacillus sp. PvR098]|uniref:beta-galactosidase n=1 Tax=unclassified Paenibacillus TaxID=185978 RepID=UPI001B410BA0|nr:beta-galactosidase [Paenibacillus sp. PvP091]MBP1171180.1 beta-galactosidase [Paenibacillus sp. PvR098]MBP2442208.1 beta-galactosidase [Paenibacillus sp. PvP052]